MKYPATLTYETGGFVVTFRDIPEAITQGDDEADALFMAKEILLSSMEIYFDEKRQVPLPSAALRGERLIALPVSVSAKVLLLNGMLAQGVAPSELARRMGTTRQEINRLIDLYHPTKIDRIAEGLEKLELELDINAAKLTLDPAAYCPVYDGLTTKYLSRIDRFIEKKTPTARLVGRENGARITVQNAISPHDMVRVDAWLELGDNGELSFYFQDGVDDEEGFNYLSFAEVKEQWLDRVEVD